jgi:bacterioferritin-associated ferredoxin
MYVCLCKGVTDGQIRCEVDAGACTLRELRKRLGVATQCGCCVGEASRVLEEALCANQQEESDQAA